MLLLLLGFITTLTIGTMDDPLTHSLHFYGPATIVEDFMTINIAAGGSVTTLRYTCTAPNLPAGPREYYEVLGPATILEGSTTTNIAAGGSVTILRYPRTAPNLPAGPPPYEVLVSRNEEKEEKKGRLARIKGWIKA